VLNEADFVVFSKLRDLRKAVAEKEGAPAYSVFTNEQLAAMVTGRVESQAALGKIDGVGSARLEKYGSAFVDALKAGMATQPAVAATLNHGKAGGA
jgi:superfamily II DNA helicase RecQ